MSVVNINLNDKFFKETIDYKDLDNEMYTQIVKDIARSMDIDLAKTPLVDLLTGYSRYKILEAKIKKSAQLNKDITRLLMTTASYDKNIVEDLLYDQLKILEEL